MWLVWNTKVVLVPNFVPVARSEGRFQQGCDKTKDLVNSTMLCTCVIYFGTFLCRSLHNYNVTNEGQIKVKFFQRTWTHKGQFSCCPFILGRGNRSLFRYVRCSFTRWNIRIIFGNDRLSTEMSAKRRTVLGKSSEVAKKTYQHVHHDNRHSKDENNEENIGESGERQVFPRSKVVMVVEFS